MAGGEVKLFGVWSSPYVLRIRWALRMKGVEFEYIEEDLSNKSPLLLKYNPVHSKVPVLVHDEKPIAESLVTLNTSMKPGRMIPSCPKIHTRGPWRASGLNLLSPSIWNVLITEGKEQEEACTLAKENLKILEAKLRGKKFLNGEKIGLADISLGWVAYVVGMYEEINKLKIYDAETCPLLSEWIERFSNSPIIKDSFPPKDKMLNGYRAIRESFLASKKE